MWRIFHDLVDLLLSCVNLVDDGIHGSHCAEGSNDFHFSIVLPVYQLTKIGFPLYVLCLVIRIIL